MKLIVLRSTRDSRKKWNTLLLNQKWFDRINNGNDLWITYKDTDTDLCTTKETGFTKESSIKEKLTGRVRVKDEDTSTGEDQYLRVEMVRLSIPLFCRISSRA